MLVATFKFIGRFIGSTNFPIYTIYICIVITMATPMVLPPWSHGHQGSGPVKKKKKKLRRMKLDHHNRGHEIVNEVLVTWFPETSKSKIDSPERLCTY